MESGYLEELELMKKQLQTSMENYMTGDEVNNAHDVSYAPEDISLCIEILDNYVDLLQHLGSHASKNAIMECVKAVVLQFNELNENRPDLIEASKSEALCDYIEFAAKGAGLKDIESDITEEWREW